MADLRALAGLRTLEEIEAHERALAAIDELDLPGT